jgi:hypothetical protein
MLPSGESRGRQFNRIDYSRPSAAMQQAALTSATDAPQASAQPAGGDDTGGHWSGKLPEGVDASWVRNAIGLIGRENVGSFEDLADPEHRKWIRRKMRKANREKKVQPEVAEGEGEETAPETPEPAATEPRRTVFPTGRIPKGRMVDRPTGGLPGPGGWVPAGEGLWWPPYPTTAGPMARPELEKPSGEGTGLDYILNAAGQSAALEGGR